MSKMLEKLFPAFNQKKTANTQFNGKPKEHHPLSDNYQTNLQALQDIFDLCGDVKFQEFQVSQDTPIQACMVYIANLVDKALVSENVMKTIMVDLPLLQLNLNKTNSSQVISNRLISVMDTNTTSDLIELSDYILQGYVALILDGCNSCIVVGVENLKGRAIDEPDTEPAVRGPRDGFVEDLDTNLTLIRRRIKSTRLKVEFIQVGLITKTRLAICYLKGIADPKIIGEVQARIKKINMDSVLGSSYIQEMISDQRFTLFPLLQYTERPDKVAGSLLEGRIAIITDNTPMVLLAPTTFITMLQASEDYYNEFIFASFVRTLRFVAINLTVLLPGVVVAIWTFHQEVLPERLLAIIMSARQNLPFPIFIEILGMEMIFELLREAGVRLPKTIGQAVSIVGGLVVGQAAVNAGFVGPEPVVVVALTAIASFAIPNYAAGTALRLLRFTMIILGGTLGFVGIIMGLMFVLIHLCDLRSFGVPYLSPIAPLSFGDLKDTIIRFPWWKMQNRPRFFAMQEPARQDPGQGPEKPEKSKQP